MLLRKTRRSAICPSRERPARLRIAPLNAGPSGPVKEDAPHVYIFRQPPLAACWATRKPPRTRLNGCGLRADLTGNLSRRTRPPAGARPAGALLDDDVRIATLAPRRRPNSPFRTSSALGGVRRQTPWRRVSVQSAPAFSISARPPARREMPSAPRISRAKRRTEASPGHRR